MPATLVAQAHFVAITVDDLPLALGKTQSGISPADAKTALAVNKKILRALSRHHVPATGFVIDQNVQRLGIATGTKILQRWIAPGFDLGNHFYSHADVNSLTVAQIEQQILRGQETIVPLLQTVARKPKYLRFPYNHTGDTKEKRDAIAQLMATNGYQLAPCTIDSSDYKFNDAYVIALARRDRQATARIRADYIAYSAAEIDWYSKVDKDVFGYDVPHVMLMHDSPLNSDTINEILAIFEQRGYRFVTLSEALKDSAYTTPETNITKFGPMWGYRWAKEKNVNVNDVDEPDPPKWISEYVKTESATRK